MTELPPPGREPPPLPGQEPWEREPAPRPTPQPEPEPEAEPEPVSQVATGPEAPPPASPKPWHVIAIPLVMAGCIALAALLLRSGVALSATAAAWVEAIPKSAGPLEDGPLGVLLRRLVHTGLAPHAAVSVLQLTVASAILFAVARAGHRLARTWGALAALVVLLVWPSGRATLLVLSAESLVALATLCMLLGGLGLQDTPRRAALWLAAGIALLAVGPPVGLALLPCLVIATLLLPAQPPHKVWEDPRLGPQPPPAWLPWLAGLVLGLGLPAALLPTGALRALWTQDLAVLRAPTATLVQGSLSSVPVLGTLVAWLGQVPFVLLLLLVLGLARTRELPSHRAALPNTMAWLWIVVLAVVGLPVPGLLDGLPVLAPIAAVAVVGEAWLLGTEAWQRPGRTARFSSIALALTAVLALLADAVVGRDDRRNALGHLPGLLLPVEAMKPVVVTPSDVELLVKFRDSTALLPARPGGPQVGAALKVLHPELAGLSFGPPYASHQALLPQHPVHPVDRRFSQLGQPLACGAQHCLVKLRGRPDR